MAGGSCLIENRGGEGGGVIRGGGVGAGEGAGGGDILGGEGVDLFFLERGGRNSHHESRGKKLGPFCKKVVLANVPSLQFSGRLFCLLHPH